jgi:SNF family Na+-dependent transporter
MITPSLPTDTTPGDTTLAAFLPVRSSAAPRCLLAAVIGALILVAGIASGVPPIDLIFVPALVVLAAGAAKLWRERP